INDDLTINVASLLKMVETTHPTVVLFINYFGFPINKLEAQVMHHVKDLCWVIEDCVQGSLIESTRPPVGRIGHFVLTSFRKYLPVPDGGLVINQTEIDLPRLPSAHGPFVRFRLLGKMLRYEFLHASPDQYKLEEAYLSLFDRAERDLNHAIPLKAMSETST